ncbi:MAG: hypothetical protein ACXQT5_03095 [Candidatus Syntropharchaeia archaeon]
MDEVLDLFPELRNLMNRKAGGLSGGERQFLAMGSALIRRSEELLRKERIEKFFIGGNRDIELATKKS